MPKDGTTEKMQVTGWFLENQRTVHHKNAIYDSNILVSKILYVKRRKVLLGPCKKKHNMISGHSKVSPCETTREHGCPDTRSVCKIVISAKF
jgi:hypothetical protein